MKLKQYLLICITLLFSFNIYAQILWEVELPIQGEGKKLIVTNDNQYLILLGTYPTNDICLLKYLPTGDSVYIKHWNKNGFYSNICDYILTQINDTCFVTSDCDGNLVLFSNIGNPYWYKNFIKRITACTANNNDLIILIGELGFYTLHRLQLTGNIICESRRVTTNLIKKYNNNITCFTNNYYNTNMPPSYFTTFFGVYFDSINLKSFGSAKGSLIECTNSGGFCIYNKNEDRNIFITDSNQDSILEMTNPEFIYLNPQEDIDFIATRDSGFLLVGLAQVNLPTQFNFIIKIDSLGNVQWKKSYSFISGSKIVNIVNSIDGYGYLMLVYNENSHLSFLVRIDDNGSPLYSNPKVFEQKKELLIYPNPSYNWVNIKFPEEGDYSLSLYNYQSQELINNKLVHISETLIDISNLNSGVYFLMVVNKKAQKYFTDIVIKK
ncbi:MAG: hypothetical protein A2X01_04175 [Bacteroidetes bacterium GWF2_35_48]|nr:MAG: hypothetical protein A2X01_04175 [Bacteroidetes bacterium GWF2_35_48]